MGAARTLVIRVWCGDRPVFEPVRPEAGRWVLGRDTVGGDDRMSRRHCEVRWTGNLWEFADLGSANGTFVDARAVEGVEQRAAWKVMQIGRSLFMPLRVAADVPLRMVHRGGEIFGPGMHAAVMATRKAAAAGRDLLCLGARGSFAVLALQVQRVMRVDAPVTVVRCERPDEEVTLPERGAVLVLGEGLLRRIIGDPRVAGALERPELRLCIGLTRRGGEAAPVLPPVLAPRFVSVEAPDLERCPEEIPWWIVHALRRFEPALNVDVTLPEACLLRAWAQSVEGLVTEIGNTARRAIADKRTTIKGVDLPDTAGLSTREAYHEGKLHPAPRGRREAPPRLRDRAWLAGALKEAEGDRARAAAALHVPLESLEQWIRRHGLD